MSSPVTSASSFLYY